MSGYTVEDRLRQCERVVSYHAARLCKAGNWLSVGGADVDDLEQAGRLEVVRLAGLYPDASPVHFARIANQAVWRRMHDLQREVQAQVGAQRAGRPQPWHTTPRLWVRIDAATSPRPRVAAAARAMARREFEVKGGPDGREAAADALHPPARDPEPADDAAEVLAVARRLAGAVPAADRRLLVWHYVGGLTLAEVGERLGLSESRVSQRHTALLRRMREGRG